MNDYYLNEQKIIELRRQIISTILLNILIFIGGLILFFMISVYEDNYWNTHAVIEPYIIEGRKVIYVSPDQVIKTDKANKSNKINKTTSLYKYKKVKTSSGNNDEGEVRFNLRHEPIPHPISAPMLSFF